MDIQLHPIQNEDAQVLMELNNSREIAQYVVGNPTVVNIEQQLNWIRKTADEKNTKRWMIYADGQPVGTIFISSIDIANGVGNVNIKLLPNYQGKGIAKQAVTLLRDIAFDELDLYCLTAKILPYNIKSIMLFVKSGFHVDGLLRKQVVKNGGRYDLLALSLLKEER